MANGNAINSQIQPQSFFRSSSNATVSTPARQRVIRSTSSQATTSTSRSRTNLLNSYSPGMILDDIPSPSAVVCDVDFSFEDDDDAHDETSIDYETHKTTPPSVVSAFTRVTPSDTTLAENSHVGTLVEMLQQQQAVLQKLMDGQKALEEQQTTLKQSFTALQDKVNDFSSKDSPSSSGSEGKRKRIVTRSLSNKVYTLHSQLENKFDEDQSYSSDYNKSVQKEMMSEITCQSENSIPVPEVKLAIRRCYENLRCMHLEQQAGKEDYKEEQSRRRKYRSRRERKFQRRSSVVSEAELDKYWTLLNLNYVTEESDDPENPNGIIEHKLPWRSEKLDKFMEILESRLEKKQTQNKFQGIVAKKVRKTGHPSKTSPPLDAPAWATKSTNEQAEVDSEGQQLKD